MTATTNTEKVRQCKIRFSLIAEQTLAFALDPNMVREVKQLFPNFKQIAWRCFTLLNIFIWIVRYILSLNSKQFQQKLYLISLYNWYNLSPFINKPGTAYFLQLF